MGEIPDGRLTFEAVNKLLSYDPETGEFRWKERTDDSMGRVNFSNSWNRRFAGKTAMNSRTSSGHLRGYILSRPIFAHRAAWLLFYREWPSDHIDHINGNPADNRISNLRVVASGENARNRKPYKNSGGLPGVRKTRSGRFKTSVQHRGVYHYLGLFDTAEAAHSAYLSKCRELGFHKNHSAIYRAAREGK